MDEGKTIHRREKSRDKNKGRWKRVCTYISNLQDPTARDDATVRPLKGFADQPIDIKIKECPENKKRKKKR